MIDIIGIPGSLRADSLNRKLLELSDQLIGDRARIEIAGLLPLPMYNPDDEARETPRPVVELKQKIEAADGLLISLPVYYVSMPGVLKNAIDWICRTPEPVRGTSVLAGKPISVIVGAGGLGATETGNHLMGILSVLDAVLDNEAALEFVRLPERVDESGHLAVEEDRGLLKRFIERLVDRIDEAASG
jgi:chromate reductase